MTKELKVNKIENGTVIDHLPAGKGLKILRILGIEPKSTFIIAVNVDSSKGGRKDMLKIEDKLLTKSDTDKISLVAPNATINMIKGGKVSDKRKVSPPKELRCILTCPNMVCVTNQERGCSTRFLNAGGRYKCYFCERCFSVEDFGL